MPAVASGWNGRGVLAEGCESVFAGAKASEAPRHFLSSPQFCKPGPTWYRLTWDGRLGDKIQTAPLRQRSLRQKQALSAFYNRCIVASKCQRARVITLSPSQASSWS